MKHHADICPFCGARWNVQHCTSCGLTMGVAKAGKKRRGERGERTVCSMGAEYIGRDSLRVHAGAPAHDNYSEEAFGW